MDRMTSWLAGVLVGSALLFSALLMYLPLAQTPGGGLPQAKEPVRAAAPARTGSPSGPPAHRFARQEFRTGLDGQTQGDQGEQSGTENPGQVIQTVEVRNFDGTPTDVPGGQQERGETEQNRSAQSESASNPVGQADGYKRVDQVAAGQQGVERDPTRNPQVAQNPLNPSQRVRTQLRRDRPDLMAFGEGFQRMLEGRYADAVLAFGRLAKDHPESEFHDDGLYWLGFSLAEAGRDEEALAALNDLVARYPASAYADDALLKCGLILQRREDSAGAERAYRRAIESYPNGEATLSCAQNLATIQESKGQWDAAQQAWAFSDEQARNQLGETDNYYGNRARNRVEWIQKNNDSDGEPLRFFTQGEILLAERRPDAAEAQFLSVLRDFPRSPLAPAARYKLGLCYQAQGRIAEAGVAFEAARTEAVDEAIRKAAVAGLEEVRLAREAQLQNLQQTREIEPARETR